MSKIPTSDTFFGPRHRGMTFEIIPQSHLDHNLAPEHVSFILERFADRNGFFRETIALPLWLGPLMCGLHGPIVGDGPIAESEVTYVVRGYRKCASRMVNRIKRETRILTVIGGHMPVKEGHGFGAVDATRCVLYTAFGGPSAPREPGDPLIVDVDDLKESTLFWAQHALSLT